MTSFSSPHSTYCTAAPLSIHAFFVESCIADCLSAWPVNALPQDLLWPGAEDSE